MARKQDIVHFRATTNELLLLDNIAAATNRNRSEVMREALQNYAKKMARKGELQ